jgi:predicted ribosomally synthesized peptide with nif11-like leader
MSVERAKELSKKIAGDEQLRSRLAGAKTPDDRKKVIEDAGYSDVSKEDVEAMRSQSGAKGAGDELSDDQLDAVAGGSTTDWVVVSVQILAAFA